MKVYFNSFNGNHLSSIIDCNEISFREFKDHNEALEFWHECMNPITTLDELMVGKPKEFEENALLNVIIDSLN